MALAKVTMMIDIDKVAIDDLKTIEHHVEKFVDLDSWSEINSIFDVSVEVEEE